ncbi:MAG: chemotaxis protein [Hespellia sp.]|nr:chemotaxis protein [Hespellia sp.]
MPKGNPKARTIAAEKYQKKAGYMTKGFKIKRDVAEEFAEACHAAGVSQAAQITQLMKDFAKKIKDDTQ